MHMVCLPFQPGMPTCKRPSGRHAPLKAKGHQVSVNLELTMRLTPAQVKSIKQVAAEVLGEQARLMLFGSRVDDLRRGGDIDL